jgi:DNA-binding Lrp family transcriptional regulator
MEYALRLLRADARIAIPDIALALGTSVAHAHKAIAELEGATIRRYSSLIRFDRLNYIRIRLVMKAKRQDELLQRMTVCPNMNSLWLFQDGSICSELIFPGLAKLYGFIDSLSAFGLTSLQEIYVIDILMEEGLFCAKLK